MVLGKQIGVGNTASVYEWGEGRVLKLFNHGYPAEVVELEYNNALAVRDMNFHKPKAYEMVTYENRKGIVYDKVEGESLHDWVLRTGNLEECAQYMAKLHKSILDNKISRGSKVLNYKDFLKMLLSKAPQSFEKQKEYTYMLDQLPDGDTLCHGDFHPSNIMLTSDKAYVIDFLNICQGNYLYDVSRTVYLIEYTPVPANIPNPDMILKFKKDLTDKYLELMDISRDMVKDYLTVIQVARKVECPDE